MRPMGADRLTMLQCERPPKSLDADACYSLAIKNYLERSNPAYLLAPSFCFKLMTFIVSPHRGAQSEDICQSGERCEGNTAAYLMPPQPARGHTPCGSDYHITFTPIYICHNYHKETSCNSCSMRNIGIQHFCHLKTCNFHIFRIAPGIRKENTPYDKRLPSYRSNPLFMTR